MREESRAGEGQLLALGDLAKVMVLSAFLFLSPLRTAPDLFLPTLSPYLSHFHSPSSSLRILPPNSAALATDSKVLWGPSPLPFTLDRSDYLSPKTNLCKALHPQTIPETGDLSQISNPSNHMRVEGARGYSLGKWACCCPQAS